MHIDIHIYMQDDSHSWYITIPFEFVYFFLLFVVERDLRKRFTEYLMPPRGSEMYSIIINAKRGVSLFLLLLYMFSNHSGMRAGTNEYERVPIRN